MNPPPFPQPSPLTVIIFALGLASMADRNPLFRLRACLANSSSQTSSMPEPCWTMTAHLPEARNSPRLFRPALLTLSLSAADYCPTPFLS